MREKRKRGSEGLRIWIPVCEAKELAASKRLETAPLWGGGGFETGMLASRFFGSFRHQTE